MTRHSSYCDFNKIDSHDYLEYFVFMAVFIHVFILFATLQWVMFQSRVCKRKGTTCIVLDTKAGIHKLTSVHQHR